VRASPVHRSLATRRLGATHRAGCDTLHTHALQGFQGKGGYMPPKGGRTDLTDQSVINAVDYIVAAAQ